MRRIGLGLVEEVVANSSRNPPMSPVSLPRNTQITWVSSFLLVVTNQVLVQLDFLRYWRENEACKTDVCFVPRQLDEEVAMPHFLAHDAALTVLAQGTCRLYCCQC